MAYTEKHSKVAVREHEEIFLRTWEEIVGLFNNYEVKDDHIELTLLSSPKLFRVNLPINTIEETNFKDLIGRRVSILRTVQGFILKKGDTSSPISEDY